MNLSLYIHVPFCVKKCAYCDFASCADTVISREAYVDGVVREMEMRAARLDGPVVADTLYLGGGTPSLLSPELVSRFIVTARGRYALGPDAEVTLEANPGTVTEASLAGYRSAGVNRLSLGVQSFDDRMLALLGRVHTAAEARAAVVAARDAGFGNIGLDLIHSLPGQTAEVWGAHLEQALELRPEHLSVYGLTVEEGTQFHRLQVEGRLSLPDDEEGALMYRMTTDLLTAAGYEQYEIANFALPGHRSRHNQVYWRREPWLGFGAAAHSFLAPPFLAEGAFPYGRRWHNPVTPEAYLGHIAAEDLPEEEVVSLTRGDAMAETLFLGLRMAEGVDTERFLATFGEPVEARYGHEIDALVAVGLLRRNGTRLFIPPQWFVLSSQVFMRFV